MTIPRDQLIEGVRAGNGRMIVADPPSRHRAAWRRLIYANQDPSRLAEGIQLRYRGRDQGNIEVWLEAIGTEGAEPSLPLIPVPEQLRRPHPYIAAARSTPVNDGWVNTMHRPGHLHMSVHNTLAHGLCS